MELESTFTATFGKTAQMTTTARQTFRSVRHDARVDTKVLNIMKKLQSRFNPDSHKAKNEKLIQHMRMKAALQRENDEANSNLVSADLLLVQDPTTEHYHTDNGNKMNHFHGHSSGFIPELSQESLLDKEDVTASIAAAEEMPAGYMTESSKFLPSTKVRATPVDYSQKPQGSKGGRKVPNLSAYDPKHLSI